MRPLLIAEKMTEIDEKFILGSMPPPAAPSVPAPRPKILAYLASHGMAAAAIAGILALGVAVAFVMGNGLNPFSPPVTTEEPSDTSESTLPDSGGGSETDTDTDAEVPPVYSEGLLFTRNPDGTYRVGGLGDCRDTTLLIPPTHEGAAVVAIDDGAFYGCESLVEVVIPDSVTAVGGSAFRDCRSLTSVTLPKGLTRIQGLTFLNCTALTKITVPDSIQSVIPSAFSGCSSLEYNVYGTADYLGNSENPYVILIRTPTVRDIHPDTKALSPTAFATCKYMDTVTVPAGVTHLGEDIFKDCKNLTKVILPDGIAYIDDTAFAGCSRLQYNTHDNALYLGSETNPYLALIKAVDQEIYTCEIHPDTALIADLAFYKCTNLWEAPLPDKVTHLGVCAFSYTKIREVTVPSGVTRIEDQAFSHCSRLTAVHLPDGVAEIGKYAFCECPELASVTVPDSLRVIEEYAFEECGKLTSIHLPRGMTVIASHTFESCGLTSVTIPDTVTFIGEYAFAYAYYLSSVTLPDSVTHVEKGAFYDCIRMTSATLSRSLTAIPAWMFGGCKALTAIHIPDSVTAIGDRAFDQCWALTEVTVPGSVETVGANAFDYCSKLTSVTLSEGVTTLEDSVFRGCNRLSTLVLPRSLKKIGHAAVSGDCTALTEVYYRGSEEEWARIENEFPSILAKKTIIYNYAP